MRMLQTVGAYRHMLHKLFPEMNPLQVQQLAQLLFQAYLDGVVEGRTK